MTQASLTEVNLIFPLLKADRLEAVISLIQHLAKCPLWFVLTGGQLLPRCSILSAADESEGTDPWLRRL